MGMGPEKRRETKICVKPDDGPMRIKVKDLKRIAPGVIAALMILGTTAVLLFLSVEYDEPPEAVITMSGSLVEVGEPIQFDGSGSTDPDGDELDYEWNVNGTVFIYEPEFNYAFPGPGNFTVVLKVTDPSGKFDTETVFIDVR
jgi:hypothetical protein